jgi:hypothetical protein
VQIRVKNCVVSESALRSRAVNGFIVSWPGPFRYNCDHRRKIAGSIAGQSFDASAI